MRLLVTKKEIAKHIFTMTLVCLLSISFKAHSFEQNLYQYGHTVHEQETLQWLWRNAQKFSGIQSIYHTDCPHHLPIYMMTKSKMNKEMCPDEPQYCRNFIGAYDTKAKRILLHHGFMPEEDMIAASFLLHEFIHALQNETISNENMLGSCARLRIMEQAAYDGQNAFLKSEGALFRAGIGMRMMVCPDDIALYSWF